MTKEEAIIRINRLRSVQLNCKRDIEQTEKILASREKMLESLRGLNGDAAKEIDRLERAFGLNQGEDS